MKNIEENLKGRILETPERIPVHVAIIMDGNGRWAAQRNRPRTFGHKAGVEAVKKVVRSAAEIGVKYLTLYTFSSENWSRPATEVAALMQLLTRTTKNAINELIENDVKLITIGRINGLPQKKREVILEAIERTRDNKGMVLNLALNYGGRSEILDAVKAIANSSRAGMLDTKDITEELFSRFLYTVDLPDPDMLIRTSGVKRISNFLLWQTSYTELFITDELWPDFGRKELFEAILDYQKRERRFGKLTARNSA
ncbi:MAG: isoprenyl transferase [candidate division Zixibacteria bacterium]